MEISKAERHEHQECNSSPNERPSQGFSQTKYCKFMQPVSEHSASRARALDGQSNFHFLFNKDVRF